MTLLGRRLSVPLAAIVLTLCWAVPAVAYICHPDARGTRTLEINGRVTAYSMRGPTIHVAFRDKAGCARLAAWDPLRRAGLESVGRSGQWCSRGDGLGSFHDSSVAIPREPGPILHASAAHRRALLGRDGVIEILQGATLVRRFARLASTPARALALNGNRLVVLAASLVALDRPATVEVYDVRRGILLHVWPLFVRPVTLDLYGDIALFSAPGTGGVFGLRLSDGLTTFFGPAQPHDTPQIGPYGVVFQSNLYERFNRQGRIFMKFLPAATVQAAFAKTHDTLATRWHIKDFSMDGQRVAVLLDTPSGHCKEVRLWSIPWHWFGRINMQEDLTCAQAMNIRTLSLAGIHMVWVATKNGTARIIITDAKSCMEHVMATATSASGILLAGDRHLLAFLSPHSHRLALVSPHSLSAPPATPRVVNVRSVVASAGLGAAQSISLDSGRLAVLRRDRRVDLFESNGKPIGRIAPTSPRAIALRRDRLAVLTRAQTLEVWDTGSAHLEHSWRVPAGAEPRIDVHYGIAVLTAGRRVYAVELESGRVAILAHAPSRVRVQIEEPGVVYEYNTRRGGFMRFIPLARVERALAAARPIGS